MEHFKELLKTQIAQLLPIPLLIHKNIVMRGYKNDVPTLDVSVEGNAWLEARLRSIYHKNYQQIEGHTSFPELEMHLTVDTDELLFMAAIIVDENDGKYLADKATLKRVGNKDEIASVNRSVLYLLLISLLAFELALFAVRISIHVVRRTVC